MPAPQVSVLIIVYNRERFIGDAIRSTLSQSLADLECIVVDDGSSDRTIEIVEAFRDPRVKLVRQDRNMGIPTSRNCALDHARGKYIAWLDSDDLSHPDRLAVQRDYLERHPETGMIGSAAWKIDSTGSRRRGGRVPRTGHDDIHALLLFRSPFQQSSIFGRRELLQRYPYDPSFPVCEDFDMFARFAANERVANLPAFLIDRRIHPGQTIVSNVGPIVEMKARISARFLDQLGMSYDQRDLERHVALGSALEPEADQDRMLWAGQWLRRLRTANRATQVFAPKAFERCLDYIFLKTALRQRNSGLPGSRLRLGVEALLRPRAAAELAREAILPFIRRAHF